MTPTLDIETAEAEVKKAKWMHTFEVLPGLFTPGRWEHPIDPEKILDRRHNMSKDLSGLRALDIGTLDGPYAFELEKRGATVIAMDIQYPDTVGFNTAKRVRNSAVTYLQADVYDLDTAVDGKFDIILFFGVWYHMKNPVLAIEKISNKLNPGGMLCFEGECLLNHIEVDGEDRRAPQELLSSKMPFALFYPDGYKGKNNFNWTVPNQHCVLAWMKACGLEVKNYDFWNDYPNQRMFGTALKSEIALLPDNPVW